MANLTLKQLRYMDALARHGHFGRAAEACAISQPALSVQIKELEESLGLALFAAVLVFDLTGWRREFCYGIPAAVLMAGAVQLTWRVPRILMLGGESSYLLYLLHPLVYSVMAFSIGRLGVDAFQNGALMLLMLLSAVGLSMAATLWIERPYIAWYKARRHRIAGALAAKG